MTIRALCLAAVGVVGVACFRTPDPVSITQRGAAVTVGRNDPPANAHDRGALTAIDGGGCGAMGSRGTYPDAVAILRNEAARRGANYVQIVSVKEPFPAPNCFHNEYTISGQAYFVNRNRPSATTPSAWEQAPGCSPPCSPGYRCEGQQCIAVCNPLCGPGHECNQQRICQPVEASAAPNPAGEPVSAPDVAGEPVSASDVASEP